MTNSKRRRNSLITGILFVLAIGLLLFSTVTGARAALILNANPYQTNMELLNTSLRIVEKYSKDAAPLYLDNGGALLTKMVGANEAVTPGTKYFEQASVNNNGDVDSVIRVQIYRYWTDGKGNKLTDVDPDLIKLNGMDTPLEGWVKGEVDTPERTVLYCTTVIPAGGETPIFCDGLTISSDVLKQVIQDPPVNGTIVTHFYYEGMQFNVEVEADSVQARHGTEAAKSAWGASLTVDEDAGTVSLG